MSDAKQTFRPHLSYCVVEFNKKPFYETLGPVLSAVILKIGFRKTIIIGAISTSLGLILSSFATNVFWLYITFGIIAGIKGNIFNFSISIFGSN